MGLVRERKDVPREAGRGTGASQDVESTKGLLSISRDTGVSGVGPQPPLEWNSRRSRWT